MASVTPVTNGLSAALLSEASDSTLIRPLSVGTGSLDTTMHGLLERLAKIRREQLSSKEQSSADAERLGALLQASKDALPQQATSITELTANVSELATQLRDLREAVKPSLDKLLVPLPASTVVSYSTYERRSD